MAASSSSSEGGTIADINVTPLVDVVLVLLIIMMVAAPVISAKSALDLNLPKVGQKTNQEPESQKDEKLVVAIKEAGPTTGGSFPMLVNGYPIDPAIAKDDARLKELLKSTALSMGFEPAKFGEIKVEFAAEARVYHEEVTRVLSCLTELDMTQIGFAIDSKP